MQQEKKKLGHILITKGILTPYTVARMLRESKRRNKRLGCILEEFGLVTSEELAAVLAQQFNLKQVSNLANNTYSPDVLQIINVEFALDQIIFPLNMDGRMLHLAIADPTDVKVINNFAKNNDLLITPYVASRKEIYAAISRHYLGSNVKKSSKTTILVVEDEDLLLSAMKDMLVRQGYHVVTATDGMEGFREVIASKPQVVVTDNVMQKLDGFALLKSIKANPETCKIPVILVSDKLSDEDEAKVFEVGFFDHIPKPFKEVTLVSRINRAVSSGELPVVSTIATELPWKQQEEAGRLDDDFLFRLGGDEPASLDTHPSAQLDGELERPETSISQEMVDFSEPAFPPPVTPFALPETVPSVAEQKPGPDLTPVSLETIRSTFVSPADFIVAAPVTGDKEAKETLLHSQSVARQMADDALVCDESKKDIGSDSDARPEPLPVHAPVSPVTALPARTEVPLRTGSSVRVPQSAPSAPYSGGDFTVSGETTAHAEKIFEDTLLAYDQGYRFHSRRMYFIAAVVLVVIAGGGYWFTDQLHLRSLHWGKPLQQKIPGQASTQASGMKKPELFRPVQKQLSSAQHSTTAAIQQLPSFVPVNGRDASFSTRRTGWERYVDTRRDVRVFRQSGRIKALQVIATPGQVITEASVKSALHELTGTSDFALASRERQGKYLLQRSRVGQRADVLLYRKVSSEAIVAFVVSFD